MQGNVALLLLMVLVVMAAVVAERMEAANEQLRRVLRAAGRDGDEL